MERVAIEPKKLKLQPFTALNNESGILLVAGSGVEDSNPMTISWGMSGIIWHKPVFMCLVRPSRHTHTFISKLPDFTVNWMPEEMSQALTVCGSKSGRDTDKYTEAGITPMKSKQAASPCLSEAVLVMECRTLYRDFLKMEKFMDKSILKLYQNDFHECFIGEVVHAEGTRDFAG